MAAFLGKQNDDQTTTFPDSEVERMYARIADLEAALAHLVADVEALHQSHRASPGDPPITPNEFKNLRVARELLANYELSE
jgi:hypothetical protein